MDAEKQELISRGARAWLRLLKKPAVVYRFDIVEVLAEPGREVDLHGHRERFCVAGERAGQARVQCVSRAR